MFLHVRRHGEVSRRPCMLIKFGLKPSLGARGARCWEYDDSRCHFACSRFPMHRRLTFASPVRTVSRDFRLCRGVLVFSVACVTRRRHRAPALASQLPFLIERGFCFLHAPSIY